MIEIFIGMILFGFGYLLGRTRKGESYDLFTETLYFMLMMGFILSVILGIGHFIQKNRIEDQQMEQKL